MKRVIVELRIPVDSTMQEIMETEVANLPGFTIDEDYGSVPASPSEDMAADLAAANQKVVLIRGELEEEKEGELTALSSVISVWTDARIEPF
jgi:hypothetical protein